MGFFLRRAETWIEFEQQDHAEGTCGILLKNVLFDSGLNLEEDTEWNIGEIHVGFEQSKFASEGKD
jgi:hypothetical protein